MLDFSRPGRRMGRDAGAPLDLPSSQALALPPTTPIIRIDPALSSRHVNRKAPPPRARRCLIPTCRARWPSPRPRYAGRTSQPIYPRCGSADMPVEARRPDQAPRHAMGRPQRRLVQHLRHQHRLDRCIREDPRTAMPAVPSATCQARLGGIHTARSPRATSPRSYSRQFHVR